MFINHTWGGCLSQKPVVKIAWAHFSFLLPAQDFHLEGPGAERAVTESGIQPVRAEVILGVFC